MIRFHPGRRGRKTLSIESEARSEQSGVQLENVLVLSLIWAL
jgi:hypothetical protein